MEDVEVVVLRIKHIDEENHVVVFTGGSWRPLTWSNGYYVDNVKEGLAAPGAWYLDRKQGVLYYHPLPGEDMTKVEVTAPVAEQLVRLEGDVEAGKLIQGVTFRGITFRHTTWTIPETGYAQPQAEIVPPAAFTPTGQPAAGSSDASSPTWALGVSSCGAAARTM